MTRFYGLVLVPSAPSLEEACSIAAELLYPYQYSDTDPEQEYKFDWFLQPDDLLEEGMIDNGDRNKQFIWQVSEILDQLGTASELILAKERPGCLSLWNAALWQSHLDANLEVLRGKLRGGKLEGRMGQVQMLGRLLSSRHKTVELAGRGRLLVRDARAPAQPRRIAAWDCITAFPGRRTARGRAYV